MNPREHLTNELRNIHLHLEQFRPARTPVSDVLLLLDDLLIALGTFARELNDEASKEPPK